VRAPAALPPSFIAPLLPVVLVLGAPLVPAAEPLPELPEPEVLLEPVAEGVLADPLLEVELPPLASAAAWNIAKVFAAGALTEKTIPFSQWLKGLV